MCNISCARQIDSGGDETCTQGILMQLGLWKRTASSSGRRSRHSGHLLELRFLDIINTYIIKAELLKDLEGVLVDECKKARPSMVA